MSSSDLGYTDFGYACDANGCVLVVQQDSTNATGTHAVVGTEDLMESIELISHTCTVVVVVVCAVSSPGLFSHQHVLCSRRATV